MSDEIKLTDELEAAILKSNNAHFDCGSAPDDEDMTADKYRRGPFMISVDATDALRLAIAKAIRDAELRMQERCYELAHHIYMERVLNQPIVDAAGGDVHAAHAKASDALRIRDAIRRLEPEGGK